MQLPPAAIGAAVGDIETPALVVDLDAFDRNLAKMARLARDAGVRLRPHAKTHRAPAVALRQIAHGAIGQCCQKVGEAEVLVRGGVGDVLISNEIFGIAKFRRLAALGREARVAVCFDHPGQVDQAAAAAREFGVEIGGLVEIEVGMQRCGVGPGAPAVELARRIAGAPGLVFKGIQAYHGTAQHMAAHGDRVAAIRNAAGAVRATRDALAVAGLACDIVGGAGTGTFREEAASGLWNELQVGSYAFMDAEYAAIGDANGGNRYTEFEHSLFVLATVMSVPAPDRVIVDAGLKSFSMEKGPPWVHGRPGLEAYGVSDEHARIRVAGVPAPGLGERLMLIPGHCDPTINLHDWYVGIRNGRVEALWPIAARGASA
jgi:D-serine deaminase-like pyridoxal phosphate-dependent protein